MFTHLPEKYNRHIEDYLKNVEFILLIGGPSGSGKTSCADSIVNSELKVTFLEGRKSEIYRTDSRSIMNKEFSSGGLIVEFATNRIRSEEELEIAHYNINVLKTCAPIIGAITLDVDKDIALSRYLHRMTPIQFLNFGKLKTLLFYYVDYNVTSGLHNWRKILEEIEIPSVSLTGLPEIELLNDQDLEMKFDRNV